MLSPPDGTLDLCFSDSESVEPDAILRDKGEHLLLDLVGVQNHRGDKVKEDLIAVCADPLHEQHSAQLHIITCLMGSMLN